VPAAKKNTEPVISRKTDRRIMRTRERLGDALIALMHEQNFDDITVKDVLDRAGVSRSTFYVHYSDKDDLLLSDVEDFLEKVSTALKRQGANGRGLKGTIIGGAAGAGIGAAVGEANHNDRRRDDYNRR